MISRSSCLALLALTLSLATTGRTAEAGGEEAPPLPKLERYVAPDGSFQLYKPAEWKVRGEPKEDSLRITVTSPTGASAALLHCATNPRREVDALRLVADLEKRSRKELDQLTLTDTYVSADRTRAVTTLSGRSCGRRIEGRYYLECSPDRICIQGYRADRAELAKRRPLLVDILANLRITGGSRSAPAPLPTLVPRRAPDNSLTMRVPADWSFQAAKGKVLTGAKRGEAGFVFTAFEVLPYHPGVPLDPTVLVSTYQPPARFIAHVLTKFGNRSVKVLEHRPDPSTVRSFAAQVGRGSEAADLVVTWTSPQGARCLGAFKMISAKPSMMGMWFSIVTGVWGPEEDFVGRWPLLEAVGASFSVSDGYASEYVRNGLARAKELQEKTRRSIQGLNRSREENQVAWEARQERKALMDSRWNDYRRGHSYWVSELEGGKVYATDPWGTRDTGTGDYFEGREHEYVHFEGQNPRHPSEQMREVSSHELERYR